MTDTTKDNTDGKQEPLKTPCPAHGKGCTTIHMPNQSANQKTPTDKSGLSGNSLSDTSIAQDGLEGILELFRKRCINKSGGIGFEEALTAIRSWVEGENKRAFKVGYSIGHDTVRGYQPDREYEKYAELRRRELRREK